MRLSTTLTNLVKFLFKRSQDRVARTGHNAAFFATGVHNGALGSGCVWLGCFSVRTACCCSDAQTGPAPQRCGALPLARPPLTKPLPVCSWFCRPNSNPAKICAFPLPSAGTHAAFAHLGWWWLRVRSASRMSRPAARGLLRLPAAPTAPRARSAPEAQDFRPPPPAPLRSAPHERHPPPRARLLRRAQGRARRGRGTAVTPPVPCLQESRVRPGHVLAPQPIAENAVQEQGGCGERPTKTGDVFKPGPGGIRGCCSSDGDTGSGRHPEVLVQGVNPSAPAEPRVRAGQGGVATRGEEGGRGFESVPGTREETLSPQSGAPSPPRSQVGGCASASRAQPCATRRPAQPSPARGAAGRTVTGRWWPPRPAS